MIDSGEQTGLHEQRTWRQTRRKLKHVDCPARRVCVGSANHSPAADRWKACVIYYFLVKSSVFHIQPSAAAGIQH